MRDNPIHLYCYQMMHFYLIQIPSLIARRKCYSIVCFSFIRFQCGLCRRYQSNVDEFIKHITEKHRMDVSVFDNESFFKYFFFF